MSLYVAALSAAQGRIITDGACTLDGKIVRTDYPKVRALPGGCILACVGASDVIRFSESLSEIAGNFADYKAALSGFANTYVPTNSVNGNFLLLGLVDGKLNIFQISTGIPATSESPLEPAVLEGWTQEQKEITKPFLCAAGAISEWGSATGIFRAIKHLSLDQQFQMIGTVFSTLSEANSNVIGGNIYQLDFIVENGELKITQQTLGASELAQFCSAVAFNWKGAWSSGASYVVGDEVTDSNIYWVALVNNSNSQPSTSNANWQAVGRIQGDVRIFTSSGTWNKPSAGSFAVVTVIGGGGGGQAGAYSTSGNAPGGWGGGPGGVSFQILPLSALGTTETVTVGGAGNGGAGATTNPGATGTSGGNSSFGNWLQAGGGFASSGSATGATGSGNVPSGSISMYPGAGGTGGASNSSSASNGAAGANGATARVTAYGGGSGGAGNISGAGGAGGTGTNASTDEPAGGGGGGGGGSTTSSSATGGKGGGGGLYGAGGAGGGGSFGTLSGNSGSGGNGATGLVIVAVY